MSCNQIIYGHAPLFVYFVFLHSNSETAEIADNHWQLVDEKTKGENKFSIINENIILFWVNEKQKVRKNIYINQNKWEKKDLLSRLNLYGNPMDTRKSLHNIKTERQKLTSIPVTTMTSKTAKAMLPPSYHPSSRPYQIQKRELISLDE